MSINFYFLDYKHIIIFFQKYAKNISINKN